MANWAIRIRRGAATVLTYDTPTPYADPVNVYEHDDSEPPRITAVRKTWTIEGLFVGTAAAVATAWGTLTALLENTASPPDGVQLVRDPSGAAAVVDSISDETAGVNEVRFEQLEVVRTAGVWDVELAFRVRVTGVLRFADADGIVSLTQTDSYAYDARGLLTRTLVSEVETISGTSAEEKARTLGLELPGASFAYLTRGPEGVDVDILNTADTRARATSVYQEAGDAIPAGVSPGFSVQVTETASAGERTTVTTITAEGESSDLALAAVRAQKPGSVEVSVESYDQWQRRATGVYTTRRKEAGRRLLRLHSFASRGGGAPIRHTPKTGRRAPQRHVLPLTAVEIVESIRVEVTGVPTMDAFTIPAALDAAKFPEDTDSRSFAWPRRVRIGQTRAGDEWLFELARVYRPTGSIGEGDLPTALGRALFGGNDAASDPAKETKKGKAAAKPGGTLAVGRL